MMTTFRTGCAGLLLLGAVVPTAMAQDAPSEFRDYQKALRDRGLAAIIPASTAFAPGYIFRYDRNVDGMTFVKRVCTQAFLTPPETENIAFPATHRLREGNFNIGFKLLPAVLASKIGASLGFSTGAVRTLDVKLEGVQSFQIAAANEFDAKTRKIVEREMNPACLLNLGREPIKDGKFARKLFLVYKASTATGFEYSFNKDRSTELKLSAALETIGSADTGFKLRRVNNQTFKAERTAGQPMLYIAADIVGLDSARALQEVSATPRGKLVVHPASKADLDALGAVRFKPSQHEGIVPE